MAQQMMKEFGELPRSLANRDARSDEPDRA